MIQTNIRIYSYQKSYINMIRTNICIGKYSNLFEYPNIRHTLEQKWGAEFVQLTSLLWLDFRAIRWKIGRSHFVDPPFDSSPNHPISFSPQIIAAIFQWDFDLGHGDGKLWRPFLREFLSEFVFPFFLFLLLQRSNSLVNCKCFMHAGNAFVHGWGKTVSEMHVAPLRLQQVLIKPRKTAAVH